MYMVICMLNVRIACEKPLSLRACGHPLGCPPTHSISKSSSWLRAQVLESEIQWNWTGILIAYPP